MKKLNALGKEIKNEWWRGIICIMKKHKGYKHWKSACGCCDYYEKISNKYDKIDQWDINDGISKEIEDEIILLDDIYGFRWYTELKGDKKCDIEMK